MITETPTLPHPWLTPDDLPDWAAYVEWMNGFSDPISIIYCSLRWDGTTFTLTPELASEKVKERFDTWRSYRRRTRGQSPTKPKLVLVHKPKPTFNFDLKDLIKP